MPRVRTRFTSYPGMQVVKRVRTAFADVFSNGLTRRGEQRFVLLPIPIGCRAGGPTCRAAIYAWRPSVAVGGL